MSVLAASLVLLGAPVSSAEEDCNLLGNTCASIRVFTDVEAHRAGFTGWGAADLAVVLDVDAAGTVTLDGAPNYPVFDRCVDSDPIFAFCQVGDAYDGPASEAPICTEASLIATAAIGGPVTVSDSDC